MNLIEKQIHIDQQDFTITNQRAVYWAKHQALILSDLHMGKGAHFRKHGIAIPHDIAKEDLHLLGQLIRHYQVASVIIVGDFIHAGNNSEVELFGHWRQDFTEVKFVLIKGNHDRISHAKLRQLGINGVHDELQIDNILFRHDFDENNTLVQVTGHVHPGVTIRLPTKRILRFPCYVQTERQFILPAFSRFTGLDTKNIPDKAIQYAFYDEDIFVVET